MALASEPIRPYAFGTPGWAEKSSIVLLRMMPVSPATTIEPNAVLMLVVQATALPAPSTTDRCEVPASSPAARARRSTRGENVVAALSAVAQRAAARGDSSVAQRHAHEVGIAVERGAVGEGELQRLGQQVEVGGRVVLERRQVVGAQHVEHRDQHAAARARRRHAVDVVAVELGRAAGAARPGR